MSGGVWKFIRDNNIRRETHVAYDKSCYKDDVNEKLFDDRLLQDFKKHCTKVMKLEFHPYTGEKGGSKKEVTDLTPIEFEWTNAKC